MSPARSAVSNCLGWVGPLAAYYLALPVIMKAIGAESFGLIVFGMTLVGYVGMVNPPVSTGNIRFLADAYGRGDRDAFVSSAVSGALLSVGLALAAGGFLFCAAPLLSRRMFAATPALQPEALAVFSLGCLGFVVSSLLGAAAAIPAAVQQYGVINLCTSGGTASGLILAAWLAIHTKSAPAVIAGQIAGNFFAFGVLVALNIRVLAAMGLTRKAVGRRWISGIRKLFTFSTTLWLSQACSTVALQSDKFIVGLVAGPAALAWYSIPAKAGEQLATAVGRVSMALYPLAGWYAGRNDRAGILMLYNAFLRLSLFLSVAAVTIAATNGDQILQLWLRAGVPAKTGFILVMAMLTALVRTPGTIAYHVANGLGKAGITLFSSALGAATSAVGVYVGAASYGPAGAACGFLASAIVTNLVFDGMVRMRLLGEGMAKWGEPYLSTLPALLAAAAASPVLAARAGDSVSMLVMKIAAAVVVCLSVGLGSGLLRMKDIRLLRQRQDDAEVFAREDGIAATPRLCRPRDLETA